MRPQGRRGSNTELAEQVRSVLASKQLTLYQVSQRSVALFGHLSPYYVPHNLYHDLRRGAYSPSLFQLFALSRISGYQFEDWLRVFGFDIECIPRLQIQLPSRRTILLDSFLGNPNEIIPWLRDTGSSMLRGVVPLSRVLQWTLPRRIGSLSKPSGGHFIYAKIGTQDALAFPELLPGSIVRIKPGDSHGLQRRLNHQESGSLVLMEHSKGLCCCRVQAVGGDRIVLVRAQLPYAEIEFQVPQQARLIGVVDLEIRSLLKPQQASLDKDLAKRWKPKLLSPEPSQFGALLRHARLRMGLSFRAASMISREIARLLEDERYFIAPGSLSDYETLDTPPRHVHKIITFCVAYALRLDMLLQSLGLSIERAGLEPMPRALVGRLPLAETDTPAELEDDRETGLLAELTAQIEQIPFFLRGSLKALSGLTKPSLKDFFWIGDADISHPYLAGGLLAVVNRRQKKPNDCETNSLWQQSLHMVLKRDGTYLCGCCSRENGKLIVHSHSGGVHHRNHFRTGDAEIIGRIVLIVRKMS